MPSAAQASMDGDVRHVGKDILNVVGKVPEGPKELTDDLVRFCGTPEGEPGTQELARRLISALQNGSAITPENALKLAELLWQGIGLRELCADNEASYVAAAATLAADGPRLRGLRAGLRDRLRGAPLLDAPGFVRTLEQTYRELCARRPEAG